MLKIRLQRVGRKHEPTFRVVLTDSKNSTKSGRMLEILGNHDPRRKSETQLKTERIQYWMSKGAKLTPTLHNMFVTKGIVKGKKVNVLPKKTPVKKEGGEEAAAPAAPVAAAAPEAPAPVAPAEPAPTPVEETLVVEAPTEAPAENPTV